MIPKSKEPGFKLQISLPDRVAAALEALAESAAPKTTRNLLIQWVLEEYALGRLASAQSLDKKEAA